MRRQSASFAAVLGMAALLVPVAALPAFAHGVHKVGKLSLVVGFGTEPAYAGETNSVQVIISEGAKPATDLGAGGGLKAEVTSEAVPGQTTTIEMEPYFEVGEFGTPGDYRAFFIPTAPGRYTFHLTGTVKGQKIDKSYTSVKDGFAEIADPASVQFPTKNPTTGELAQRLDREVPRLNSALEASRAAELQARNDAKQARDEAGLARLLAIVGIVAALAGLVVAGIALTRRPTAAAAGSSARTGSPEGRETPAGRA